MSNALMMDNYPQTIGDPAINNVDQFFNDNGSDLIFLGGKNGGPEAVTNHQSAQNGGLSQQTAQSQDQAKNQLNQKRQSANPSTASIPADLKKYGFDYTFYKNDDDEIQELKKWMNSTESKKKVTFSKNGLINYCD